MGLRIFLSFLVAGIFSIMGFAFNTVGTLISGKAAGLQFESSDTSYLYSNGIMNLVSGHPIAEAIGVIIIMGLIWRSYITKALRTTVPVIVLGGILTFSLATPAMAYYEKQNWTENYFILPNESAFFIADVGANMNSQAKFGSEDYFAANKIASKRFQIPHTQLANSGSWSDYWVPSGRLIIVSRDPYSREWIDAADRGSSAKKEGIHCQSKEGLDVTIGLAIGASVTEDNAAKFLYRFGVKNPVGDKKDPNVIFTSVFYGKSLEEAMNGPIHAAVSSIACNEVAARTLNEDNIQATQMMVTIQKNVSAYLSGYGINLDFIGFADTFTFSDAVQKSIDDAYAASTTQPYLNTLERMAEIRVKEGLSDGLRNHGLPNTLLNTGNANLMNGFTNLVGGNPKEPATK
jgi:hypothetical protein